MAKVQSEYEVESLFIDRLQELQYEYVSLSDYKELVANFRKQLCIANSKTLIEAKGAVELSDAEFGKVMLRLENHSVYDSARILREQWVLELDNGKTVYLSFFKNDYEHNVYQVAHQITMDPEHKSDVVYENRYDVTLLINGLPLVQVELKRPGVEINEAVNQINRYRAFSFKGLFRYIQIFVVSNSVQTKYFANANERQVNGERQDILKSLVFYWTDANNKRINSLMDFTSDFLARQNITNMIAKYMVVKESEPVLMAMRPYQIYAVQRAFDRIIMSNMNGYVFHTTGSGKTLTSFKLATLLRDDRRIDRVFFLIDRKDLDDQTVDEYNSFEKDCVDNTENTYGLVQDLKNTGKKLIITTIQKMAIALKRDKYKDVMDPLRTQKCVFIIDECHRSQFGKMHGDIKRHFERANYIGFTGTPIFEENKGGNARTTADIFKAGTMDPCIHRYMIKEAIADGNVLRFSVEYMRSINVKALSVAGIDPKKIDDPEYCKAMNIDLDALYHRPERIEAVTKDILEQLERHIHPSGKDEYTAIFATDKISTLMQYYECFKKFNDKGYRIAAIFTYQANEDTNEGVDEFSSQQLKTCMDDYNRMFGTAFELDTFDAYRKDISRRLKEKDLPKVDLLLVVDMFLTGFDSKKTNTLILDKNLVWHSLMQAYSRTNRIDKVTKQFGQIINYRNIKKAQDDALKLFSGDGNPNEFLLQTYEYYLTEYRKQTEDMYALCATADEAGHLQSEDDKRQFVLCFRKIAHTLAVLKTFSKFDWKDLDVFMDEATFEAYKSWYLTFYDEIKKERDSKKKTVLADVDFEIELVRTDKINVVYILNLLKDVNRKDKEAMKQSIDLILREIERSDNEKLRYKREIMKAFVTERFFELDPDEDVMKAYEQYEREKLEQKITEFSNESGIEEEIISEILNQYFVDRRIVSKEWIRQKLSGRGLGILKLTKLINQILGFVQEMYDAFTAEGD